MLLFLDMGAGGAVSPTTPFPQESLSACQNVKTRVDHLPCKGICPELLLMREVVTGNEGF